MGQAKTRWSKRPVFRRFCDEWLQRHPRKTKNDLAIAMGMPNDLTLKQYYSGSQNPSRARILVMAKVFGCSPQDLSDEAMPTPAGVPPTIWDSTDLRLKVMATTMFSEAKEIPADKLERYIEALKKAHESVILALGDSKKK